MPELDHSARTPVYGDDIRLSAAPGTADPLRRDVRLLGRVLGRVIVDQSGAGALELEEQIRRLARDARTGTDTAGRAELARIVGALDLTDKATMLRAFGLYFQLANLAEQHHRVRRRRRYELEGRVPRESLDAACAEVGADGIARAAQEAHIELVLTAHPTEATRLGALAAHQRVSGLLEDLDARIGDTDPDALPADIHERVLEEVTIAWQTDEIRSRRPRVVDEVRQGLWFFQHALMEATGRLLSRIWRTTGSDGVPLAFGSWIGGDQDGNPFAGPDTMRAAVREARELCLASYRERVRDLAQRLSISSSLVEPSASLLASIALDERELPSYAEQIGDLNLDEPYRRKLTFIWERLRRASTGEDAGYRTAHQLLEDLHVMRQSLVEHAGAPVAAGRLSELIAQVAVFGFHLARLDVRLHAADIPSERADAALAAAAQLRGEFGDEVIDRLVVSGTTGADDVRRAYEACARAGAQLAVVPLFETIDDLDHSTRIVEEMLELDQVQRALADRTNTMEVMVGYSDSAKDGGYLAAQWYIWRAQRRLDEIATARDIGISFFHGRGGSAGRGGGPTHAAILAQPVGTPAGRLRVTEQGETISFKYGLPALAERNLEAAVAATMIAASRTRDEPVDAAFDAAASTMAEASRTAFLALVRGEPSFVPFFRAFTPVDELSLTNIGSRPVRRSDAEQEPHEWLSSLRAIPWVFSWTQNRSLFPAWYGCGTGLDAAAAAHGWDTLAQMYEQWGFFRALIDNLEMTLAKASLEIARGYLTLVPDELPGERLFRTIEEEHARVVEAVLRITESAHLLERHPVLRRSIELRNPYVDPMNAIQVELLLQWRAMDADDDERGKIARLLARSIAGIATGLRNTG